MRFLADENVDQQIVTALRNAGHDVSYVAELEPGRDDAFVLDKANQENRLLITADKDFGEMIVHQQCLSTGVILLRLEGLSNQYKVALALRAIEENRDCLSGHLVVVEAGQTRTRPLKDFYESDEATLQKQRAVGERIAEGEYPERDSKPIWERTSQQRQRLERER